MGSSIAAGEWAENEIRKDFTPSERVAILATIERKTVGNPDFSIRTIVRIAMSPPRAPALPIAKARAGRPSSPSAARRKLVAAMDRGEIAIEPAAERKKLGDNQ